MPAAPTLRQLDAARLRLLRYGARTASDAELLALVLECDGLEPAERLLADGLEGLCLRPFDELVDAGALTARAAPRLAAALELGRRSLGAAAKAVRRVRTPSEGYQVLRPLLSGLRREETWVLCLSPAGRLLKAVRVAEGSSWACHVDPREVFAPALACRASGIVLGHNHPSGDCTPSAADLALTAQLAAAGRLLCVQLIDHLVVGSGGYSSLAERGELPSVRLTATEAG